MKHLSLFLFGLVVLLIAGCRKEITCEHPYYIAPAHVNFVGFDTSELQVIYIDKFKVNTNFSELIFTDTVITNQFTTAGDTVTNRIGWMEYSFHFKVRVPAANRTYEITDFDPGPLSFTYTSHDFCNAKGTFVRTIKDVKVDGISPVLVERTINLKSIILIR